MTRSRIGPLALEAPLGGPNSHIYRAIHVQQRSQVAVRVFPMPMGMTPESKQEFAANLEKIKTLKHPGVVRCYGGGFDAKDAYLVYELVEGESLDHALERRERLPWETVLDYGLQLCEALQRAHEAGWIHGRIRPDKVLLTLGGEVAKLNEIWQGPAATHPPRPEDLAYQSPEQVEGKGKLEVACDLYSLGATLYHALTGRPPFAGANAGMVRQAILVQDVEPVAAQVFDCPVWLSAIVEQLMHKDPLKRPYSATATSLALREAQKRATSGVAVVQHAVSGFSPLQMNVDKDEAEKILGRKKKKKRSKRDEEYDDSPAMLERPLVLVGILLFIVATIGYFLMPLSEKTLRYRAELFLAQEDVGSLNEARDRYLIPLIERFPESESATWAEERLIEIEMVNAEQKMQSNRRFGREPSSEGERKFVEANRFEQFGDRVTALDKYKAIVSLLKNEEKERPFVNLARRQIEKIESSPPDADELRRFLQEKLNEADKKYGSGDLLSAKQIWEGIVSLYNGNKEMLSLVERAQGRLEKLKE
ncbi:Serine/threonine-protein kinase PknA [Pirellula sp. SH-Sr6A]|uniref:serine/threonine protein kinase n=1 Tax=Pirellula sp. SH-Sr6A TaxID=1632865 RepID=UPI00078D9404|nr:serine/threonine-protein kinase [Pirellula sp. SH-Sr6A]AMV33073.1 Serine/threonine-protein kinase PknA [Pirellula sp. SH-Sr6A]